MTGKHRVERGPAGRPRDYSAGTRAALALQSQGTCYLAGCTTGTIEFFDGEPFTNCRLAHDGDRERRVFGPPVGVPPQRAGTGPGRPE